MPRHEETVNTLTSHDQHDDTNPGERPRQTDPRESHSTLKTAVADEELFVGANPRDAARVRHGMECVDRVRGMSAPVALESEMPFSHGVLSREPPAVITSKPLLRWL